MSERPTIAEAIMTDMGDVLKASLPWLRFVMTERPSEDLDDVIGKAESPRVPAGYVWEDADIPDDSPTMGGGLLRRKLLVSVVVAFPFDPESRTENLRAKGRRIIGAVQAAYARDLNRGTWTGAAAVPNASDTIEGEAMIKDFPVPKFGFVQVDYAIPYTRSQTDPTSKQQ